MHKSSTSISHDFKSVRKIRKSNVDKAIELVVKEQMVRKKRKITEPVAADCKITSYCKSFQEKRRRMSIVGFSKSLALSEMQSYVTRRDWKHALNLFPRLLEYPTEVEPLIWRYALIILLHANDPLHLRQFFEQCVGIRDFKNKTYLKRLLLLPLNNN